ncbi:MAG: hypothetical protein WCP21_13005 [Armatimonadota bacterium]
MKYSRIIIWLVGLLAFAFLVWRVLLPLGFFWSLGRFDSSQRVPHPTLQETQAIAADLGLVLPPSARVLDAFQEGSVDHTIYVRLFVSPSELGAFTDQKLLAGKWQDGKGFTDLPQAVSQSWAGHLRGDNRGWRCWNDLVPYVKDKQQLWGLDIAVHRSSDAEATIFIKITQT